MRVFRHFRLHEEDGAAAAVYSVSLNPDGSLLAFASRRGDDKKATLHVMPVDGPGELRRLCAMDDGLGDLTVGWFP